MVDDDNLAMGSRGPATSHGLRILTNYRKNNHPKWIEAVHIFEPLPSEVGRNWEKKYSLPYRAGRQAIWAWRLFRASRKYDVILTGSDGAGLLFGLAQRFLRRRRVPHVYLDFLIHPDVGGYKGALIRHAARFALSGASYALVQRTCEAEAYSRALNLPASKFYFVPYHTTMFDDYVEAQDDGYIFAGGDGQRDYPLLIEAVRDLPYRVIIAALQREHFANIEIPKNVEIVTVSGREFLRLMAVARLNVVPLKWRPQHMGGEQTYLNAMALGKPVIVTDLGASDYITNGVNGFLTPPGDIGALRDAIKRVMEDRELATSLGHRARESAANFTPEKFFAAVFDLCRRCV